MKFLNFIDKYCFPTIKTKSGRIYSFSFRYLGGNKKEVIEYSFGSTDSWFESFERTNNCMEIFSSFSGIR